MPGLQSKFRSKFRRKIAIKKVRAAIKKETNPKKVSINRAKFLSMVKRKHPKLYKMALVRASQKKQVLKGLGETASWWDNISTAISNVLPQALQFKQQKDLMDMQLKRAEAGLPPANVADYTPVVKVQADVAPETRTAIIDQLGKPLIFGGLALAAYMMLGKKRR